MKAIAHGIAGTLALLIVVTFWVSTVVAELFLDNATVAAVKQAIVFALFLLVPALATAGISGFALGRQRQDRLAERKERRMRFIGANGLLVLMPCALFLDGKAATGEFDLPFHAIQSVELLAGMAQIALLGLNLRDGFTLAGKRRPVR